MKTLLIISTVAFLSACASTPPQPPTPQMPMRWVLIDDQIDAEGLHHQIYIGELRYVEAIRRPVADER